MNERDPERTVTEHIKCPQASNKCMQVQKNAHKNVETVKYG